VCSVDDALIEYSEVTPVGSWPYQISASVCMCVCVCVCLPVFMTELLLLLLLGCHGDICC